MVDQTEAMAMEVPMEAMETVVPMVVATEMLDNLP